MSYTYNWVLQHDNKIKELKLLNHEDEPILLIFKVFPA